MSYGATELRKQNESWGRGRSIISDWEISSNEEISYFAKLTLISTNRSLENEEKMSVLFRDTWKQPKLMRGFVILLLQTFSLCMKTQIPGVFTSQDPEWKRYFRALSGFSPHRRKPCFENHSKGDRWWWWACLEKKVQGRQGTSSQYQNSYLDLAVWYRICQLNQNIINK